MDSTKITHPLDKEFFVSFGDFFSHLRSKRAALSKERLSSVSAHSSEGVFRPCHLGERLAVPETLSLRAGRHLRGHSHWLNGQLARSLRRTHRHKAVLSAESI